MARSTPVLATRENMQQHAGYGVVAYDRYARAQYSADEGDYWMLAPDEPLRGMFGKPLILARCVSYLEPILAGEDK